MGAALTANQGSPSRPGPSERRGTDAGARKPETRQERDARRSAYLAEWRDYARTLARSPRTLRRYAAEKREGREHN